MSESLELSFAKFAEATHAFTELSQTANTLNAASDKLAKVIEKIDLNMRKLNLGVDAWVDIYRWSDERNNWGIDEIGYDKVNGKWGIALRSSEGNENWGEFDKSTTWLFKDAPRDLRIRAVECIPDLIQELNKRGNKMAADLADKTREANDIASALAALLDPPKSAKGLLLEGTAVKR